MDEYHFWCINVSNFVLKVVIVLITADSDRFSNESHTERQVQVKGKVNSSEKLG